ncbi:hypothetical protein ACYATO_07915 [Lactobacillaceae bacterium Melli_B3]
MLPMIKLVLLNQLLTQQPTTLVYKVQLLVRLLQLLMLPHPQLLLHTLTTTLMPVTVMQLRPAKQQLTLVLLT